MVIKHENNIPKPKDHAYWSLGFAIAAAGIVLLRLVIWKIFRDADMFVKEDLSNLVVAALQFALGAGFIAAAYFRRVTLCRTGFEWPLGLMAGSAMVSCSYTLDFSISLRTWLALAGSMVFFYVLANSLVNMRRVRWFLCFILVCALVTSFYGIQEFFMLSARQPQPGDSDIARYNNSLYYILTYRRVTSFLGWPNSLAGYLLLILPFSGLAVVLFRQWWAKFLSGLVFMTLVGCLLVTFSFLGWLSLFLATIIILPVLLKRFLPLMDVRLKAVAWGIAGALVGLFVVVILRKNFAGSIAPRMEYYDQVWQLLLAKPLAGYGMGAFGIAARPLVTTMNGFTNFAHNSYLQWWVECGLFGFAGILGLVFVFVVFSRRMLARLQNSDCGVMSLAVIWGLTAFFIDNLFSFTLIKPNIGVHGWTVLAVFAALVRLSGSGVREGAARGFSLAGGFLVCAGSLWMSVLLCTGLLLLQSGREAINSGNADAAGRAFVKGSLVDRWSSSYPMAAGDAMTKAYQASGREYFLRLAEANFLEAVRREPRQYNAYFLLGRIYLVLGENDKALFYSRKARELSPYEYERDMALIAR